MLIYWGRSQINLVEQLIVGNLINCRFTDLIHSVVDIKYLPDHKKNLLKQKSVQQRSNRILHKI